MRNPCWLVLMVASALLAQDRRPPTFRVDSSRAVIGFLAIDESGRVIDDLSAADLELKLDGVKQEIDNVIPPARRGGMSPQDAFQPGFSVERPGERENSAAGQAPESLLRTVVLLDSRSLAANNFAHSAKAIREFVLESLEANHLVQVAEIDGSLRPRTAFTRSRSELLQAIDKLRPATLSNRLDSSRLSKITRLGGDRGAGARYMEDLARQVQDLRAALRLLCYQLSAMPGRKHVVFFSEGYPTHPLQDLEFASRGSTAFGGADERQAASRRFGALKDPGVMAMIREVVSLANSFGVTFYTVDARGLQAVPGLSAGMSGDAAQGPGRSQTSPQDLDRRLPTALISLTAIHDLDAATNTLVALAAGTNGSAFLNSNDLGAVLEASTLERRSRYLLVFEPKLKGKSLKFRAIELRAKRNGVRIRAQRGFYDVSSQQLASSRRILAFESPERFNHLRPIFQIVPEGDAHFAVIGLPGGQVSGRSADGKYQMELLFLGRIFDRSGSPVADGYSIKRFFKVQLSPSQFDSLASQPVLARQRLRLERGEYRLVLVAEDLVAGTLGAASRTFRIE